MTQDSETSTLKETSWFASLKPEYTSGNEVILLKGGVEYFPELERQIDLARTEVFLETYIFENDNSGRRIARALARAAERGVFVRLMIDGFGSKEISSELTQIFNSGPVQWQVFRPEKRYLTLERQRLRRLHRKLAVIDGAVAFVGGINILDDYHDPNHGALEHPRFDFAVRIRGPMLAAVHLAVSRLWWQQAAVRRPVNDPRVLRSGLAVGSRFDLPNAITSQVQACGPYKAKFIPRDNFKFRRAIEQSYLRAIARAKNEVLISNAYFLPGFKFRRALIHAAGRGVKVRLLLQGLAEYKLQHWATQALYQELLQAGVEIYEYKKSFLHAKVALADDWVTVGSSNIDPFSLLLAREANVVILDQSFADQLRLSIEEGIRTGSQKIELHEQLNQGWFARLKRRAAFTLLRLAVAISGASGRY